MPKNSYTQFHEIQVFGAGVQVYAVVCVLVGLFVLGVKKRALHDIWDCLLGRAIFKNAPTHLQQVKSRQILVV